MNSRILVIGDYHSPYCHRDAVSFLSALKDEYQPDRVIQIGDERDVHACNFHDHDPDLLSAGDELAEAIKKLMPIYELFPDCDVLESNHGSLIYRKAVAHGLPRASFKSYRDMIQAPPGWHWHFDLTIQMSDGNFCYFHHGKSATPMGLSQTQSMCAVQGHYHEKFCINYWANTIGLFWQAFTGCLIDHKSLAMAYNQNNLKRPILGSLMILDGHPKLKPMILDKDGRWIKKIV